MAKTNTAASGVPPQASSSNVTNPQNTFGQSMLPSVNPPPPAIAPVVQAVSVPGATGVLPFAGLSSAPNYPPNLSIGQSSMQSAPMMPQVQGPGPVAPEAFQQPLQILQALQAQGVPQDQWATVLSVLMSSGAAQALNPNFPPQQPNWQQNGAYPPREDLSRDRNGYNDQYTRSPPGRHRNRSRSRSPAGWDRRREATPPRRRDSPVYGDYDGDASGRNNGRGNYGRQNRGNNSNDYRQRSPTQDRFRRSASPRRPDNGLPPPGPKWMEYDRTMAEGTIKGKFWPYPGGRTGELHADRMHPVLSRTLFVGGVT
jgi:protein NRD1